MKSTDDQIRRSAALVLGRLASPGALGPLCPGAHAIYFVGGGRVASPEALPALCAALNDTNESVRRAAIGGLGTRASPESLVAAMKDKSNRVRTAAAKSLLSAMQNGASFDQASEIVDLSLQNYQAARQDWEKIPMAALIEKVVAQSVTNIETGLLVKIGAMGDAHVEVYGGTDDSGDRYTITKSLQFAKTRMAASSELARRSEKKTGSVAAIREPIAARSELAGRIQSRNEKPESKGWLRRLWSVFGRP